MALALVRITPEWSRLRTMTLYTTFAFIINWIALVVFFTAICALQTSWQYVSGDVLACSPAIGTSAANMATGITGDIYLVTLPLYRLWRLRLPAAHRRLVRIVFSTSVITLVAAVAALIFTYGGILRGPEAWLPWMMILKAEEALSVIASNLTVLISWAFRVFSGDADDIDAESNKHVTPHWTLSSSSNVPPPFLPNDISETVT
ncbi:hypothetical protein BDQ17DRAFT_1426127 [Cyathus striatus]|nr:hypothetical protein BDQ17DRAFT_1426127 [Cyathus striatus]